MYIRLMKNGASGIIEPFYDGGEAYRDYHKYVVLERYKVEPDGAAQQTWATAKFFVKPHEMVSAERECDLDLGRFDEVFVNANLPEYFNIKVIVNGKEILSSQGKGTSYDYSGRVDDKKLKSIRMEFVNNSDDLYGINVSHIGVNDSKFLSEEDIKGTNTKPDWEGCFEENPTIELYSNFFADDGDLLRTKMNSPYFKADYEATKKSCENFMKLEPENAIKKSISGNATGLYIGASTLSFVGFIEKDLEMLKMAARYALSLASCETWYLEDKELVTGVTWNGRVFYTAFAAYGISIFMEFGASILTWHGRNYLYEALARKGIARLDADFKMMEYIYHMNQGLAFSPGYIYSLLVMSKRFPRYKKRIDEIEADVLEMVKGTINPDGGMVEGLGYWSYTIESFALTAYALAKYRGKSLYEYLNGALDKTSDFAITMSGGKNIFRTVGDAGRHSFLKHISSFMYQATKNPVWKQYYDNTVEKNPNGQSMGGWYLSNLIFGEAPLGEATSEEQKNESFIKFPDCGYTYLEREGVEFFSISGKSFSHCHPDKGSFTIDLDNEPILIDRGMVAYSDPHADELSRSWAHNMAIPVVDGVMISQNSQHGYSSTMVKSEFENGRLEWISDNDNVWDKTLVTKNVRTITSENPYEYEITDEFEFTRPCKVAFILNMYNDKHIKAEAVNWKPIDIKYEQYSIDYAKQPVMRLCMTSDEGTSFKLVTKVSIIR